MSVIGKKTLKQLWAASFSLHWHLAVSCFLAGSHVWLVPIFWLAALFGLHHHLDGSCFWLADHFGGYTLFWQAILTANLGYHPIWSCLLLAGIHSGGQFWLAAEFDRNFFSSSWQSLLTGIYIWLSDTFGWRPFWSCSHLWLPVPLHNIKQSFFFGNRSTWIISQNCCQYFKLAGNMFPQFLPFWSPTVTCHLSL